MKKIFDKRFDEKNILDVLKCNRDKDNYVLYSSTLNDVIANDLDDIEATAYFVYGEKNSFLSDDEIETIYCVITLGSKIDLIIKNYFDTGQYLEGLLLSTLGDEILNSLSVDLNEYLKNFLKEKTFLTKRFEIGNFPPEYLQKIFNKVLEEDGPLDFSLTSGYMITNSKSMAYFYGVSKKNCGDNLHNCSTCLLDECERKKFEIKIKNSEKVLTCYKFDNLLDVLNANDIKISANCNGKSVCKKCKVEVSGKNTNLSVLACDYYVIENITIYLPIINDNIKIESDYKIFPYEINKYELKKIENLTLMENKSFETLLEKNLNLDSIKKLNKIKNFNESLELLIENKDTIIEIGNTVKKHSVVIDIGTTTVVLSLIDLVTGEVSGTEKFINPQKKYGADIISRINHTTKDKDTLTKLIVDKIVTSIDSLILNNKANLHTIIISGNTTMIYLLCGVDPYLLSTTPFTFSFNKITKFSSIEILNKNYGDIIILPSISAYIGGDITSGILATNLVNSKKNILLVDIGTNGEIVLKSDKIYCCATAAGPVFEGSNIDCGTPSVGGAIYNVTMVDGKLDFKTIGNEPAIGICGSGVVDIMSILLETNMADESGLMEEFEEINLTEKIYFSQKDIRSLQLAKSSIFTGIETLLHEANISYDEIDILYLGGGFGNNVSIRNTVKIGLLPKELESKIIPVGNCALYGTIKYATNYESYEDVRKIVDDSVVIELATNDFFSEKFIENLNFN